MKLHSEKMLDYLREGIRTDRFPPGARLPSIISLSRKFDLTEGQVRYGLARLKKDGLAVSRHGKGFFVMNKAVSSPGSGQLVVALDILNRKVEFYNSILDEAIRSELGDYHILQTISPRPEQTTDVRHPDAVMLFRSGSDPETFRKWSEYARRNRIPVIFFNRFPARKNLSFLSVDYSAECFRVVLRMLKNGARNIVFYQSCSSSWVPLQPRLEGFRKAYAACGLEFPEELLIRDDSLAEQERFIGLLRSGKADVLFCPCGTELINAVSCAVSAGVSLQDRLPVFCFDDVGNLAERMNLPVSYIQMPLVRMARIAVNYIMRRAASPDLPPVRQTFEAAVHVQNCKYLI